MGHNIIIYNFNTLFYFFNSQYFGNTCPLTGRNVYIIIGKPRPIMIFQEIFIRIRKWKTQLFFMPNNFFV